MWAASNRHVEAVRALLEAGAEVNHQSNVSHVGCVCYVCVSLVSCMLCAS